MMPSDCRTSNHRRTAVRPVLMATSQSNGNGQTSTPQIKSNQIKSNYFIVRLKVDQRAGQLSLPHRIQTP